MMSLVRWKRKRSQTPTRPDPPEFQALLFNRKIKDYPRDSH